jgi:hypothetical protein
VILLTAISKCGGTLAKQIQVETALQHDTFFGGVGIRKIEGGFGMKKEQKA